ncbi:MAG: hypothetical protein U0271_33580 [Polyangiaceae bacterium]
MIPCLDGRRDDLREERALVERVGERAVEGASQPQYSIRVVERWALIHRMDQSTGSPVEDAASSS